MKHLILRVMKDKRTMMIAYTLVCIGFIFLYTAMFPSIKTQQAAFNEAMKAYPESVMKAMGIKSMDMSTVSKFLTMEYFSILWPLITIMVCVTLGGFSIAGEIEAGTIPMLLALPLSRAKVYFGKLLSNGLNLAIFTLISILAVWPIAKIFGSDAPISNLVLTAISGFIFGLAVLSLASFLSVVFSDKGKAYFLTGGMLLIMYVLNIISALKDNFVDLKYFSLFYYFDAFGTLVDGKLEKWVFVVPPLFAVTLIMAGYLWFKRRDIAI